MNSEGYKDPTAEHAIQAAGHLPEHIWEPLRLVRNLLGMVQMELISITVRDRRSKRKYTWGGDTVGEGNTDGIRRYESRDERPAKKDQKGS